MLAGLQGSGKTTLAGKLANFLKESGNTPLLVAADLQRPNAVNQLSVIANGIDIPILHRNQATELETPLKLQERALRSLRLNFTML